MWVCGNSLRAPYEVGFSSLDLQYPVRAPEQGRWRPLRPWAVPCSTRVRFRVHLVPVDDNGLALFHVICFGSSVCLFRAGFSGLGVVIFGWLAREQAGEDFDNLAEIDPVPGGLNSFRSLWSIRHLLFRCSCSSLFRVALRLPLSIRFCTCSMPRIQTSFFVYRPVFGFSWPTALIVRWGSRSLPMSSSLCPRAAVGYFREPHLCNLSDSAVYDGYLMPGALCTPF